MFQSLFGFRGGSSVPGLNACELAELLQSEEDVILVDVRSAYEYEHDGHISGSRLLPLPALQQRADELPKNQQIVFVCRSGNRSQVAAEQLARLGYSNVKNFDGGMIAWQMAGLPVT